MTLTPIAERFAVKLLQPVFTNYVCLGWDSNTQPSDCEANALTLQHRRGKDYFKQRLCLETCLETLKVQCSIDSFV